MSKVQRKRKKVQSRQRQTARPVQSSPSHASARAEEKRRRQQPARNKAPWIWGGCIFLAIIIIGVFLFVQNQHQSTSSQSSSSDIKGVVTYSNLSREHVTGRVNYPQVPPVGGPHYPIWLNCGIYDKPVVNENAVHSMEHGAVWITYQPSLSSADVQILRNLVHGHSYIILSPYPGLPTPVVITAWGVQLKVNSAHDPRLAQFIAEYEQGPQTPEPGAACTGGVGSPLP